MIKEINLDNYSLIDTKSASSKGNQQKWLVNDFWYKADHMGYEGLCEVIVSELLKKSNITDFAEYFPIKIEFAGRKLNGCYSKNFRQKNESIVTLEHLSKQWLASSMAKNLLKYDDVKDKISRTVDFIENKTGCRFLTVDAYAAAVPFYMKNGFVPLNDEDVDSATRLLYFDLNDIVL